MKSILKQKIRNGFTLVELLAVIIILSLTISIGFNAIVKSINSSKEKAYQEQVNRIVNLSKTWAVTNTNEMPNKKEIVYITIDNLREENLLDGEVINPNDNSELDGCIKITYEEVNNKYTHDYLASGDCPDFSLFYNITYDLDGGILEKENPTTYTVRTETFILNNPTKSQHYFVGWQLEGTTETRETTRIYKGSTGDKKYTAIWQSLAYNLTIDPNGGIYDGSSEIVTSLKSVDANVEIKTPQRDGYTFDGWTVEAEDGELNEAQDIFTMGFSDAKLTANWSIIPYTITYNLNGGSATNPTEYNVETETFSLNNPTKTGYIFTGWTGSNGSTASTSVSISKGTTGNKTYTANWADTVYTYNYTGDIQTLTAPATGTYYIELYGAKGGDGADGQCSGGDGGTGGKGGYVKASVTLTKGTSYTIYVGGAGSEGQWGYWSSSVGEGGYSDGSNGSKAVYASGGGGGGGGSTRFLSGSTVYVRANGGGGGGGGADGGWYSNTGSIDGNKTCGGCSYRNMGAAGTKGGSGGGGTSGGSGAANSCNASGSNGGAGSYYVDTTYATYITSTNGARSGNGYAVITYVG